MTPGQRAYEADRRNRPFYHDGTPRPPWRELRPIARWSWERNPTPLPCAPLNPVAQLRRGQ